MHREQPCSYEPASVPTLCRVIVYSLLAHISVNAAFTLHDICIFLSDVENSDVVWLIYTCWVFLLLLSFIYFFLILSASVLYQASSSKPSQLDSGVS